MRSHHHWSLNRTGAWLWIPSWENDSYNYTVEWRSEYLCDWNKSQSHAWIVSLTLRIIIRRFHTKRWTIIQIHYYVFFCFQDKKSRIKYKYLLVVCKMIDAYMHREQSKLQYCITSVCQYINWGHCFMIGEGLPHQWGHCLMIREALPHQ